MNLSLRRPSTDPRIGRVGQAAFGSLKPPFLDGSISVARTVGVAEATQNSDQGRRAKRRALGSRALPLLNRGSRPRAVPMRSEFPQRRQSNYLTADEDNETLDHLLSLSCESSHRREW